MIFLLDYYMEVCKYISKEADILRNKISDIDPEWKFLDPSNWITDTDTAQEIKNILNIDLVVNDIIDIKNSCKNIFQRDYISANPCLYCQNRDCSKPSNLNSSMTTKICMANGLINKLRQDYGNKKSYIASKAIQDFISQATGNKIKPDLCKFIKPEITPSDYFNKVIDCAGISANLDDYNSLKCGDFLDKIRQDSSDKFQKCMAEKITNIDTQEKLDKINGDYKPSSKHTILFGVSIGNFLLFLVCCFVLVFGFIK